MTTFVIEVSKEERDLLINGLAELPAKQSYNLLTKIASIQPKVPEVAPVVPTAFNSEMPLQ